MSINIIQRRERIFDVFSTNLRLYLKKTNQSLYYDQDESVIEVKEDVYICPLCMNGFLRQALDQTSKNPLTFEHVPPRSAGGKPLILLCKECNSKQGKDSDHVFSKALQFEQVIKKQPGSSIYGKVSISHDSCLRLRFSINKDKNPELFIETHNNTYLVNSIKDNIEKGPNTFNFEIDFPNSKLFNIALLRSGYLLAFNHFGYDFILQSNSKIIRDQILNPSEKIIPHSSVQFIDDKNRFFQGIHFLNKPNSYRSYAVAFPIKQGLYKKNVMVYLPGPGDSGWDSYSNLNKKIELDSWEFIDLSDNKFLLKEEFVDAFSRYFLT